jgi:uncharacterized membrane protein YdjX (TVP38/TMEM64 family)
VLRRRLALVGLLAALGVGIYLVSPFVGPATVRLLEALADASWPGRLAFVAAYALVAVLGVPSSAVAVFAGAAFGFPVGTVLAFCGEALGAMTAFLLARTLARRPVERWLSRHPRLRVFDAAIAEQGFRTAFLLRLSPVVPFAALNYTLGVSRLRWRDATLSCIGMLPAAVAYVAAGHAAAETGVVVTSPQHSNAARTLALLVGALATVLVTLLIARAARRALASAAPEGDAARPQGPG